MSAITFHLFNGSLSNRRSLRLMMGFKNWTHGHDWHLVHQLTVTADILVSLFYSSSM